MDLSRVGADQQQKPTQQQQKTSAAQFPQQQSQQQYNQQQWQQWEQQQQQSQQQPQEQQQPSSGGDLDYVKGKGKDKGGGKGSSVCYKCQGKDHRASDCPTPDGTLVISSATDAEDADMQSRHAQPQTLTSREQVRVRGLSEIKERVKVKVRRAKEDKVFTALMQQRYGRSVLWYGRSVLWLR